MGDIVSLIDGLDVSPQVRSDAKAVYSLIAEAESIASKAISEEKEILEIVNGKIDG